MDNEQQAGMEVVGSADIAPNAGESLADFAKRAGLDLENLAPDQVRKWQNPSPAEIKTLIADSSQPLPVRLFWRQQMYGRGGGGRKAWQQESLQRRQEQPGQHVNPRRCEARRLSGKERKIGRRLLRQMGNVIHGAE